MDDVDKILDEDEELSLETYAHLSEHVIVAGYGEAARQLVGDETGETYRVGQRLTLRLAEANPVSGSLRFELPEGSYGGPRAALQRRDRVRGRRGRPLNIRHDSRRR